MVAHSQDAAGVVSQHCNTEALPVGRWVQGVLGHNKHLEQSIHVEAGQWAGGHIDACMGCKQAARSQNLEASQRSASTSDGSSWSDLAGHVQAVAGGAYSAGCAHCANRGVCLMQPPAFTAYLVCSQLVASCSAVSFCTELAYSAACGSNLLYFGVHDL